jgi:dipeptidyl aminopeptidase/acylaminoacyl peptidase
MKQDLEPQARRDDAWPPDRDEGRTLWVTSGVTLVVVLTMIAIGLAGVLSASDRAPRRAAAPAVASSSPIAAAAASTPLEPPVMEPADVSFVDLRTGKATPLPRSIRSIPYVGHFRASPDGSKLAFDDGGSIHFDDGVSIFVSRIDGTHIRRFTSEGGTSEASAPSWSPDGRTIVFSDGASISLLDVATGHVTRLIHGRGWILDPNFSADGRTILYTSLRDDRATLRTIRSGGGVSSFLMRGAFGAYSPDGTTIAYRRTAFDGGAATEGTSGTIWLADADGSNARALGSSCCWMSQGDPFALWPMWSPDGKQIAYQPLIKSPVKVIDVGLGRTRPAGNGTYPSWLDDHTLIIEGFSPVK